MGIRTYKPTSAGRRNASVSDFAELTPEAEIPKALRVAEAEDRRPQQPGQDHLPGIAAAATSSTTG